MSRCPVLKTGPVALSSDSLGTPTIIRHKTVQTQEQPVVYGPWWALALKSALNRMMKMLSCVCNTFGVWAKFGLLIFLLGYTYLRDDYSMKPLITYRADTGMSIVNTLVFFPNTTIVCVAVSITDASSSRMIEVHRKATRFCNQSVNQLINQSTS